MIKKAKSFVVQSIKDVLGGEPVFRDTRVPVRTFIEYLEAGDRLDDFLRDYPTVTRQQAIEVLELAKRDLVPKVLAYLGSAHFERVKRIA